MGEINAEVRALLGNFRKKLDRLRLLARKQGLVLAKYPQFWWLMKDG